MTIKNKIQKAAAQVDIAINAPVRMKITIDLTEAEVKGIKDYLREVADIPKPGKKDIQSEMQHTISGYLQAPQSALTDYINKHL